MALSREQIYAALIAKNTDPDDATNCFIDHETNTIWALAGEGKLKSFWSPSHIFKYMSDEEINQFLIDCLKPKE